MNHIEIWVVESGFQVAVVMDGDHNTLLHSEHEGVYQTEEAAEEAAKLAASQIGSTWCWQ